MIARRLRVGALVALVLAVVAYWATSRTVAGQDFGDAAYGAPFLDGREVIDLAHTSVALLVHGVLLLAGAGLVAIAIVRQRPRLAVGVALLVFGTALLTEVLKGVLTRPDLGVDPAGLAFNSGPSGHASIAMALALGLVMVAPMRLRPIAAAAGATVTAIIGTVTLAAGWYRPGDVLPAELLSLGIALLICSVIVQVHGDGLVVVPRWTGNIGPPWVVAAILMAASVLLVDVLVLPEVAALDTGHSEFITASALISALAIACLVVFTALLRDVDVDAPLDAMADPPPASSGVSAGPEGS